MMWGVFGVYNCCDGNDFAFLDLIFDGIFWRVLSLSPPMGEWYDDLADTEPERCWRDFCTEKDCEWPRLKSEGMSVLRVFIFECEVDWLFLEDLMFLRLNKVFADFVYVMRRLGSREWAFVMDWNDWFVMDTSLWSSSSTKCILWWLVNEMRFKSLRLDALFCKFCSELLAELGTDCVCSKADSLFIA